MKLVILDRDGVINRDSANFIKSPNEWVALPGSLDAIALLNQSGYSTAYTRK
jgi:D-glycero-D-manno-heptose 1,7-bisphosphate phosphatase